MYPYKAFDLNLHSDLLLPELLSATATKPEVVIQMARIIPPERAPLYPGFDYHFSKIEAYFFWNQAGRFLVRNGTGITVDPIGGAEERVIRLPLLGVVMAVLLHQRGLFVLHGSTISLNGAAAVFLGHKGMGKSTIAAALYSRGHYLVSDDIIALNDDKGNLSVLSGYPQFKLWPDAALYSLGEDIETLPYLHPQVEKRGRQVTDRYSERAVPLKRIYILERGSAIDIQQLKPHEAMIELIRYTYVARFGNELLQGQEATHFAWCAELAGRIPVYRLVYPTSLPQIPAVASMVEKQFDKGANGAF